MRPIDVLPGGSAIYTPFTIATNGDGTKLAVATTLAVFIYGVRDFTLENILAVHSNAIISIDWCKTDPDLIVTSSNDHSIRVWSVSTCVLQKTIKLDSLPVCVRFNPHNSGQIGIVTSSGHVYVYNRSEDNINELSFRPSYGNCFCWDILSQFVYRFVVGGRGMVTVYCHNKNKYKRMHEIKHPTNSDALCRSLAFDPVSQDYFVTAWSTGDLIICNADNGEILNVLTLNGADFCGVQWIPGIPGGFVTTEASSGVIRRWNVSQPTAVFSKKLSQNKGIVCQYINNEYGCVFSFDDGQFILYDVLKDRYLYHSVPAHTETVFDSTFVGKSPDSFISVSYDGTLRFWEIEYEKPLSRRDNIGLNDLVQPTFHQRIQAVDCVPNANMEVMYCVVQSPDSMSAMAGGFNGNIYLFDLKNRRCMRAFKIHEASIYRIAWSRFDASLFASTSRDRTVVVSKLPTGSAVWKKTFTEIPYSVAFVDATTIVVGFQSGVIELYNIAREEPDPRPIRRLKEHRERVFRVEPNPAIPNLLASVSDDLTVRVWDISKPQGQEAVCVLEGHTNFVRAICWNPAMPFLLLSGGWDSTIRVWDIRKPHTALRCISDHASDVYAISIHPQRPFTVLTISRDTTIRLWSLYDETIPEIDRLMWKLMMRNDEDVYSTSFSDVMNPNLPMRLYMSAANVAVFRQQLAHSKNDVSYFSTILSFFSPPNGLRNFLVAVVSELMNRGESLSVPISYQHHSKLFNAKDFVVKEKAEVRALFNKFNKKRMAAIGEATPLDIMQSLSVRSLRIGDLEMFCKIECHLKHWERALALAPLVSMQLWSDIMRQYASSLDTKSESDMLFTSIISDGDSSLSNYYESINRPDLVMGLPKMALDSVNDAFKFTIARDSDPDVVKQLCERYIEEGEPVYAAIALLTAGSVVEALNMLVDCEESALSYTLFNLIIKQKVDVPEDVYKKYVKEVVYKLEHLNMFEELKTFVDDCGIDTHLLVVEIVSRNFALGTPLHDLFGLSASPDPKSDSEMHQLEVALLTNNTSKAAQHAIAILTEYYMKAKQLADNSSEFMVVIHEMREICDLVMGIDFSTVSKVPRAHVYVYMLWCGFYYLRDIIGEPSLNQRMQFHPNDGKEAGLAVSFNIRRTLLQLKNTLDSEGIFDPISPPLLDLTDEESVDLAKPLQFNVMGGSFPLPPPGAGSIASTTRRPMTLWELCIWSKGCPLSPFGPGVPPSGYTNVARNIPQAKYSRLQRIVL
ncbi:hypothetical protein PCE1_000217 [Barthelona sp. PCE]